MAARRFMTENEARRRVTALPRENNVSIFDKLSSALGGAPGESGSNPMLSGVMGILSNHPGGVSGLAQSFEQNGLGHLMSSWIGTGENLPISSDQVKSVLGNERVAEFAAKAGISPDTASSHLAELLPDVINKLSPDGKLPEGGSDLMSQGMSMLGGLFSKGT